MEKKSDIQKSASNIRKSSKARESKVITSDMRKSKGDPQSQRIHKPEKEKESQKESQSVEQKTEQQPSAQQDSRSQQKPERKIVNEDEQKQVVNNPGNENSPTEAEDQK
jgi:hypothetical protein